MLWNPVEYSWRWVSLIRLTCLTSQGSFEVSLWWNVKVCEAMTSHLSSLLQAESLLRWCLGTADSESPGHTYVGNTVEQTMWITSKTKWWWQNKGYTLALVTILHQLRYKICPNIHIFISSENPWIIHKEKSEQRCLPLPWVQHALWKRHRWCVGAEYRGQELGCGERQAQKLQWC